MNHRNRLRRSVGFDRDVAGFYFFAAVIDLLGGRAVVAVLVKQRRVIGLARRKQFAVGHFYAAVGIQGRFVNRLAVKTAVNVVTTVKTVRLFGKIGVGFGVIVSIHRAGLSLVVRRFGNQNRPRQHFKGLKLGSTAGHALPGNITKRLHFIHIRHFLGMRAAAENNRRRRGKHKYFFHHNSSVKVTAYYRGNILQCKNNLCFLPKIWLTNGKFYHKFQQNI